jgi:hypothetical protein
MNLSFPLISALGGGSALRVQGPDNPGRIAFTRTSAAMTPADNAGFIAAATDTPRFSGITRRLLVEGARTNMVRNPRFEGAAPGTNPAFATLISNGNGVSLVILGTGAEGGMPYLDLLLSGTAGGSGVLIPRFESTGGIPAATGQTWTAGLYIRQVGGTAGRVSSRVEVRPSDAGNNALSGFQGGDMVSTPSWARTTVTGQLTASGVAYVQLNWRVSYTSGVTYNEVIRIAFPSMELAPFASTPMLPPAGTLAAAERAADVPVWSPPGGFGTQGTVVVKAMLPQLAVFGASQGLWQIDDGTDQTRLQLRNTSAGSAVTGVVDINGVTVATLSPGNMTPGTPFRAAFAWAAGDQALCLGGGAVQTAAAALPAGLTRMLLGHASAQLNRAAFGEIELVDYAPTRLPNAFLQAMANAA